MVSLRAISEGSAVASGTSDYSTRQFTLIRGVTCDRLARRHRERRRRVVEGEPADRGDLVGFAITGFAGLQRAPPIDRRDPMLFVDPDHLDEAEQGAEFDLNAHLLQRLAPRRRFCAFEKIDLAADQAPRAGLGRLAPLDQQNAAFAKERGAEPTSIAFRFTRRARPANGPRNARPCGMTSARIFRWVNGWNRR